MLILLPTKGAGPEFPRLAPACQEGYDAAMKIENASSVPLSPDESSLARAAAWMGWGTLAWYAGTLLGSWVLPWSWRCALGDAGDSAVGRWLLPLVQMGVVFAGPCLVGYAARRWRREGGGPFRGRGRLALVSLAIGAAAIVLGHWSGWVGDWCFWLGAVLAWMDFGGAVRKAHPRAVARCVAGGILLMLAAIPDIIRHRRAMGCMDGAVLLLSAAGTWVALSGFAWIPGPGRRRWASWAAAVLVLAVVVEAVAEWGPTALLRRINDGLRDRLLARCESAPEGEAPAAWCVLAAGEIRQERRVWHTEGPSGLLAAFAGDMLCLWPSADAATPPARYWYQYDRMAHLLRWKHDLRVLHDLSAMPPGPDRDAAWAAGMDAANRHFPLASGFFQPRGATREVWILWKEEADAAAAASGT